MTVYVILFLLSLGGYFFNVNGSKQKRKIYLVFIFVCILLIAVLRDYSVGTDLYKYYSKYYPMFKNVDWDKLQSVTISGDWEWGFCAFCKVLAQISPNTQLFIIGSSIISIIPYAIFIYKNSEDVVFSTFFYIAFHIFMMSLNIVRQAMAVGIVLIGFEALKRKQHYKFVIYVLIATLFHTTAVVALLYLIIDRLEYKKHTLYLLTGATLVFSIGYRVIFNLVLNTTGLSALYGIYGISGQGDSGGYITFHTLGMFCIALMIFAIGHIYLEVYGYQKTTYTLSLAKESKMGFSHHALIVRKTRRKYLVSWSESLVMYAVYFAVLFRFNAFIINVTSRFAMYFFPFLMISFPHSLAKMNKKSDKMLYMGIMIAALALFFFVIIITRAEALWGTLPYRFYWYN